MPFFSIIIPTRNRYETLKYSILTVLNQDFNDYELIISDNSDPENYFELDSLSEYSKDERIRFIRPEKILSMSDHWEFALANSVGRYVIIFGDDDGLIAGALQTISQIISETKMDLISWARVEYNWPNRTPQEYANQLVFPIPGRTGLIDGVQYIKKVIKYQADYRYLPMLYNSAVSKDLIDLLRKETGRVFNASSPDIYSGFAFAHLTKRYLTIGHPLSINGVSAKSNGAAHSNKGKPVNSDHWSLLTKSEIRWPKTLPDIYSDYLGIIEPFIQLSYSYPELTQYIRRKKIYKILIDLMEADSSINWDGKIAKILKSAENDRSLHYWLKKYVKIIEPKISSSAVSYQKFIGFDGSHLILDASSFGLENVYDVSLFIPKLIGGIKDRDFPKPLNPSPLRRIRRAFGVIRHGF
jgi:glycosyltransferase involved in cell wall biosynthesis